MKIYKDLTKNDTHVPSHMRHLGAFNDFDDFDQIFADMEKRQNQMMQQMNFDMDRSFFDRP